MVFPYFVGKYSNKFKKELFLTTLPNLIIYTKKGSLEDFMNYKNTRSFI